MAFLNDKEIRSRCLVPTHMLVPHGETRSFLVTHDIDNYYYFLDSGTREQIFKTSGELLEVSEVVPKTPYMITPFVPGQVRRKIGCVSEQETIYEPIISYGTSSMGYDVRLGRKFKIFTNVFSAVIDPLNMPDHSYVDHEGDYVVIPPNSYVLGHTIEYFNLPRDVGAICVGKSTYARAGCAINVTPIEPGFSGEVVIEIANQTPLPMKVYAEQGIAQFVFLKGNPCEVSYSDRSGKYQGQTGIQTAIV